MALRKYADGAKDKNGLTRRACPVEKTRSGVDASMDKSALPMKPKGKAQQQ